MHEPELRAWIQEYVTPARSYAERPGRWVGVSPWPIAQSTAARLTLAEGGVLAREPSRESGPTTDAPPETWLSIEGEQHCGETAGVWCANGIGDEMAEDQRPDDDCSLAFTTEPLDEPHSRSSAGLGWTSHCESIGRSLSWRPASRTCRPPASRCS